MNAIIIQIIFLIVSITSKFSRHFDFRTPHVIHSVFHPLHLYVFLYSAGIRPLNKWSVSLREGDSYIQITMYSRGSGRFHLFSKPILLFPFDSCMVSYFHWSRRSLLSSSSSWSTFLFGTGSKVSTNDKQPTFLSRSSIHHKMDLKLIKSGREKIQILHHGLRCCWNFFLL